ncbi:hypothetical protein HYT23_04075 [Candidatus Pacearchaeota archaeon]|nr:hypothetical protein [Candidatus Pacearchaeota archaeon]
MKLCESVNPVEAYEGRGIYVMPRILSDGRVPMTASQLMNYRISQSQSFPAWKDNWFFVSDLVAYSREDDGKAKFVLTVDKNGKVTDNGRTVLGMISPRERLSSGAVELGDRYDSLNGVEVAISNLGKTNNYMTRDEILGNKVWKILARHPDEVPAEFAEDPALLGEYISWVESQTGNKNNMAVYVDSLGKSPKLRAWYVSRLDGRSDANGRGYLVNDLGRFVGIAPEAPNARVLRPTLEQSLSIVNQNLEGLELSIK